MQREYLDETDKVQMEFQGLLSLAIEVDSLDSSIDNIDIILQRYSKENLDTNALSPIISAIRNGNLRAVKKLLEKGLDPTRRLWMQKTQVYISTRVSGRV